MPRKAEKCIMPPSQMYATERRPGLHRHEVFFGTGNRQKSIDLGLVVFLTPEMHNMGNQGVHFNKIFDLQLKKIGQRAAMDEYGWSVDDFRKEFGRNYLEVEI